MAHLKILLYIGLDFLWTKIGQACSYFRKGSGIDIFSLNEIVINRSDRLGDAIISLPFLRCFVEKTRSVGWNGIITVITSDYNYPILEPLASMEGVRLRKADMGKMTTYEQSIMGTIRTFIRGFRYSFHRLITGKRTNTAFIDLVDSVSEMSIHSFPEYYQDYWLSSNRGPFTPFFDITSLGRFAGSSQFGLIDSYIGAFSQFFGWDDLEKFVSERSSYFYPTVPSPEKSILVFVGVKEYRNFEAIVWERMIRELARELPGYEIHVSDMKNHAVLEELEKAEWPENVTFVRNIFSFAELGVFASRHELVIGVDGGDINMMRPFANSVTIFTLGNPRVWGPFLFGKSPTRKPLTNGWQMEATEVRPGRKSALLYKESFWLPSFQVPLSRSFVSDFDVSGFVQKAKELLQ